MTNHFATLGVAPAPWMDADLLKEKFLERSAQLHPDKSQNKEGAEAEFRALNESYQVVRNTRSRVLHFLELHGLAAPPHVQSIPAVAADLFAGIAELTGESEKLLKEKASASSPMLKVQWFERALRCVDRIQALQSEVQNRIEQTEHGLRELPAQFDSTVASRLSEAAAALGFLERWRAQLHERAAALTF